MPQSTDPSYKTELALLAFIMVIFLAVVSAAIWINSIDIWCDNPDRPGNWIVQPLCESR